MDSSIATSYETTMQREQVLRRLVRRVAASLGLLDADEDVDLSGIPGGSQWEREAIETGGRQLGVFVQIIHSLDATQALDIVHEGHVVIISQTSGDFMVLEKQSGRGVEATCVNGSMTHSRLSKRDIARLLEDVADAGTFVAKRELSCQPLAAHEDPDHEHVVHTPPLRRFFQLLKLEANDIGTVILFALVSGILALATPLAVESLVNVVSWGTYLQPLLVLALILLAALGLSGVLRVLQTVVVEIIQRRQFVRVVGDLAHRFPRAKRALLQGHYPRELANRVFDIMTIQKATAVLLLDGVSILLTSVLGMLLLAFYHPILLGFNVALLFTMVSMTWLLGRGGISTSIDESIAKYKIAHWLQDVLSFPTAFKINGGEGLAIEKANNLAAEYLLARERQFRVVIRQVAFAIGLQVVASTVVLGLGGWLVINQQLTLGQLVASELVVTVVVGAFAKAGKSFEKFYDLMAGIDKVGHLIDLPVDRRGGRMIIGEGPASLEWSQLRLRQGPNQCQVPADQLVPGESLAVVGEDTSSLTMFIEAVAGLGGPHDGVIEIAAMEAQHAAAEGGGKLVAIAAELEIFHATLAENIKLGRPGIGEDTVRAALRAVGLWDTVLRLDHGLATELESDGFPLSRDQQVRLMLARAIVTKPRLLVINRLLDELPATQRQQVWAAIVAFVSPCTIVLATRDAGLATRCDRKLVLAHSTAFPSS